MKILVVSLTISFLFLFAACSDSTGPDSNINIIVRSEMSKTMVQQINTDLKNQTIQISEVDSVKISKIRILLSDIKFHSENESNEATNNLLKAGPVLFIGDSTGNRFELASGKLPAGQYNKIKFEIHRFSSSELSQYVNDSKFGEFATDARYTVIIDGFAYKTGISYAFTYKSTPTANLSLPFTPSLVLVQDEANEVYLQVNPIDLLKINTSVIDPRDPLNINEIDNLIKSAIKAVKKT